MLGDGGKCVEECGDPIPRPPPPESEVEEMPGSDPVYVAPEFDPRAPHKRVFRFNLEINHDHHNTGYKWKVQHHGRIGYGETPLDAAISLFKFLKEDCERVKDLMNE